MPELLKKGRLDKLAAEARANPERSRLVYDSAIPGFFARLRGGRLSFGFGYRYHGKERRMVLGEYGRPSAQSCGGVLRDVLNFVPQLPLGVP